MTTCRVRPEPRNHFPIALTAKPDEPFEPAFHLMQHKISVLLAHTPHLLRFSASAQRVIIQHSNRIKVVWVLNHTFLVLVLMPHFPRLSPLSSVSVPCFPRRRSASLQAR